ncbi:MAG: hypothetical protein E7297_02440 [Lachnospiraceae bacterium]|nr:hypothetical protein [Lachnospiraceae bacterium]
MDYKERFWFAYELNRESNIADRVYRYNRGLMERKNRDGSWAEERGALCIFCGEDLDYEEITEDEAEALHVRI